MRDAGSNDPVLIIDEIDKMGTDFRGDPASAMLEVLDPEQKNLIPRPLPRPALHLSSTFFIFTADQLDTVPIALRDRMEIIELAGYTHVEEKREIAKRYLVPRRSSATGWGARRSSSPTTHST